MTVADGGVLQPAADAEAEADAPAELSAEDFYPEVMAAMQDAETFSFTTVSSSAGQSQTMTGQARFSDDGIEMKASSEGPQAMELVLLGQALLRPADPRHA